MLQQVLRGLLQVVSFIWRLLLILIVVVLTAILWVSLVSIDWLKSMGNRIQTWFQVSKYKTKGEKNGYRE